MADIYNCEFYIFEEIFKYNSKVYYKDVTKEWLKNSNTSIKELNIAKYVIKNGKRYYVNSKNKIEYKNREKENAEWYIDIMGGKLNFLPNINEDKNIQCADYRYYPPNSNKGFYIEEKETHGKSRNVFYHALENKEKQANVFIIDCTDSHFTETEIYQCLNFAFSSRKMSYVKIIIIKNNDNLFGVFKKRDDTL